MSLLRLWHDRSGNMSLLFAGAFAMAAGMGAIAVDSVSLYNEQRQLQSSVDLAAISAVSDPSRASEIVQAVLRDAGLLSLDSAEGLTVRTGHYDPSRTIIADRFKAGVHPVNAVKVSMQVQGTLHFAGRLLNAPMLGASGTAAVTPEVSFSVGSRLASFNGGIANALLSKLLGTTVSLSVLDYTALASARIDAFGFLDALATQMGVRAVSYNELLAMNTRSGPIAAALASQVTGTARTTLQTIARAGRGNAVPLGQMFSLGELGRLKLGSEGAIAGLSLSAMEVLSAAAALADGDRQVSIALGADLPGLLSLGLDLAIGDPPRGQGWFAIGSAGTVVRTAQLRLRLKARLLGGLVLSGGTVNLPLYVALAPTEARLVSATCPTRQARFGSVVLDVLPGTIGMTLGEPNDTAFRNFGVEPPLGPTRLVDVLLALRVTGSGRVEAKQTTPIRIAFSSLEIAAGEPKPARTQTLMSSVSGSLLNGLDIDVDVLGFGLSPSGVIAQAVRALIVPLAPTLDMTINATLSTLGLGIGEADLRVYGVRCHNAVLVG